MHRRRERERERARRQQQKQPFGVLVVLLFPPLVLQCGLEIDGRVMGEREGGGELAASAFEVHSVREKRGGRRFCFARLRGGEGLELLFSLSLSLARGKVLRERRVKYGSCKLFSNYRAQGVTRDA